MNRPWSNWIARLLNTPRTQAASRKPPAVRLEVERLECRVNPATTITIIAGAAGAGTLDSFLSAANGTIKATDAANVAGTLSQGALQQVGAGIAVSITAQNSIVFDSSLTTPVALQTSSGNSAQFTALNGGITFDSTSESLTTAGGGLTLDAAAGALTLGALATSGGDITLGADSMTLGGTISAGAGSTGGVVNISPLTNGTTIDLGTKSAGNLGLSQAELNEITGRTLRIGDPANTGNITVTRSINVSAGVATLALRTSGAITNGGGSLTVQSLALRAGAGIGATGVGNALSTAVTNLAASNGTTGDVIINNTSAALDVAAVDGVTGAANAGGMLSLSEAGGLMDIKANVGTTGGGEVSLITSGAGGDITLEPNVLVSVAGGNGAVVFDSSAATSGGQITFGGSARTDPAGSTGLILLNARTGVSVGNNAYLQAGNNTTGGAVTINANAGVPGGTSDIVFGTAAGVATIGNITLNADPDGNGVGGGITLAPTTTLAAPGGLNAGNITLVAGKDVTAAALTAVGTISIATSGNILEGNGGAALVAANIALTAGGRIGGGTAITAADVESASTATPTAALLGALDVSYTGRLTLYQPGALGNVQIRKVNAGLSTSSITITYPTNFVGSGNQFALISSGGDLTIDNAFSLNGTNNANVLLATTGGKNIGFVTGGSFVNNGATATTTLVASGSTSAAINGLAPPDNSPEIQAQKLQLVTTGGNIGSSTTPLEFDAVRLDGFTNGTVGGTAAGGGTAYMTDTGGGLAVGQFNAGTGNVTLTSRGNVGGTGVNLTAVTPNDNVPEIIGNIVTLNTSAASANGATGQIGSLVSGTAQFFEIQATQINATTNNSRAWISAIGGSTVNGVNVGTDTAILKAVNGNLLGNHSTGTADITAGTQVTLIGVNGGFGTSSNALQVATPILNAGVTSGTGSIQVLGVGPGLLTINNATTVSGLVSVGGLGNVQVGSASATGTVISATGNIQVRAGTSSGTNNLTIGTASSTAAAISTAGSVNLFATGQILDGATPGGINDLSAGSLAAEAGRGIGASGAPLKTAVGTLAAKTDTSGDVDVSNTGNLVIGTAGAFSPLTGISSAGAANITTTGSLDARANVTATTGATLTTVDAATAGQNLTVEAGVTVSATSGNVNLQAGDNLTVNGALSVGSTGTITLAGDFGVTDPDPGTGSTITLGSSAALTSPTNAVRLVGNSNSDTFNVRPFAGVALSIAGAAPTTLPGDVLNISLTGATGTTYHPTATGNGNFTFTNRGTLSFTGIETLNTTGGTFALTLDMNARGFQDGNTGPDVVSLSTTGGVLNVTVQNNSTGTPVSVFSGLASVVSSFTLVGSTDSETVNVDETNPGLPTMSLQGHSTSGPGDKLNLNLTNAAGATFTPGGTSRSGTYSFSNRNNVQFSGFASFSPGFLAVVASLPNASERGVNQTPQPGQFTFTRAGDLSTALTVNFTLSGTAVNGKDYQAVPTSVTFAAGASTAVLNINVINNSLVDGTRTVVLNLAGAAGYALNSNHSATVSIADNDSANRTIVSAAAVSGAIKVFENGSQTPTYSFIPYAGYLGGLSVAVGDVNGDGIEDFASAVATPGAPAHIKVFDGSTGAELVSFIAFPGYQGGLSIALGDVRGIGRADIIVGTMTAMPVIGIYDGLTGAPINQFSMFQGSNPGVGVNVAAGDLYGTGTAEIIAGLRGIAPHVKAFDVNGNQLLSFYAFDPAQATGGVTVSTGDLLGNGTAEIMVGASYASQNFVSVFNINSPVPQTLSLPPGPHTTISQFGPTVAAADLNGDNAEDLLVAVGPMVNVYNGPTLGLLGTIALYPGYQGGIYLG